MSDQRAFRGVWIPADLWLNRSLSIQEKVMLIEIDSLAKDPERGCYKKNQGFAEFFGLSKNRVSEIIKSLETKGFIRVHYQRKGQEIVERNIFIIAPFDKPNTPSENCDTPFGKSGEPPSENCEERGSSFRGSIEGSSIGTSADAPCGVCDVCGGDGYTTEYTHDDIYQYSCPHCNGTGKGPTCKQSLQVQDVRNSRTTEQQVDWSKAPADATHWNPLLGFVIDQFGMNLDNDPAFVSRPDKPVVNSELTTDKPKPKKPTKAQALFNLVRDNAEQWPALNCVDDNLLSEWAKLRTRKGASSEQRALNTIEKTLEELRTVHGIAPDTALAAQCDAGWATVKVEYLVKNGRGMSYAGKAQSPYDSSSDFRDLLDDML